VKSAKSWVCLEVVLTVIVCMLWLLHEQGMAQEAPEQNVKLNLNGASLKEVIKLMETYTGKRFLFDENLVVDKRVNLFSSKPLPVESMFQVFEAILEVEGLTLLETGEAGSKIYKIIDIQTALKRSMPTYSKKELENLRPGDQIVTLMYQLEHAGAEDVAKAMSGLTTIPGGVVAIPGTNLIQVTDFAANVKRLGELLALIDKEGPKVSMETIKLQNVAPDVLVQEIQPIIDVENRIILNQIQQNFSRQVGRMLGQRRQQGIVQFSALQYSPVTVVAITRLGSVIVSCDESRMASIRELVKKLDVVDPESKVIKYYKIQYADAQSIAQVLSSIFDVTSVGASAQPAFTRNRRGRVQRVQGQQQLKSSQKAAVVIADENLRTLVVVASKQVHEEIEKVIKELDIIGPADAVLRFYKVENTDLHKTAEIIGSLFQLSLSTQVNQLRQIMSRARGGRRGQPAITQEHIILPDENLNSLLVVAPVEVHEKIKEALEKIDIIGSGEKSVKHYELKYANPEEVARILGSIFDMTVNQTGTAQSGRGRGRGQQVMTSRASKNAVILASAEQAKVIVVADDTTHKEIEKIISDLDIVGPNENVVKYYAVNNADIEEIARIISEIFGLTQGGNSTSQVMQQLRRGRQRAPQATTVAVQNVIIINENLGSLIVVAPKKLHADIEETIKSLDIIGPGERIVKNYKIENADVDELAQTLGSIFGLTVGSGGSQRTQRNRGGRLQLQLKPEKSSVIIPNADLGTIVVVASKPIHEEVARVIESLDIKGPNESIVAYYPVENADLNETASIISQLFSLTLGSVETGVTQSWNRRGRAAGTQKAQANTIIPDENLNVLVVVAAQKVQDEIKATIIRLDVVGPGERVVRYYKIKSAQVSELANTLSNIFELELLQSSSSTRRGRAASARGRQTQVKPEMKPVIIAQPELATIVVVASKAVQEEVAGVINNLDLVGPQTNVVEYYRLEYTDISETANILSQVFGIKVGSPSTSFRARGRNATEQETRKLTAEKVIIPDDNLNNIIVVAPKEVQEEVKRVLSVVDIIGPRDNELKFYEVDITQVDSAAQILSQLYNIPIGSTATTSRNRNKKATTTNKYGVDPVIIPDSERGSIVINAPPDIHEEISKVLEQLHLLGNQERMTIKFYKLKNTDAEEIADKIGNLFGISVASVSSTSSRITGSGSSSKPKNSGSRASSTKGRTSSKRITEAMGAPKPYLAQDGSGELAENPEEEEVPGDEAEATGRREFQYGGEPVVVPDKNLNSIIVIAPEYVHEEIDKIIRKLDQRRPQVMFEVAIIDVSADNELELGVEWTAVESPDSGMRGHGFTNFGIGERTGGTTGFPGQTKVSTTTSGLFAGITKGTYGNIPLLLKVLESNNDVNIRSTPILLVNDNEEASFSSLVSEPTTSISQGTATTNVSFSGFVDAGTELTLTPHISEGDYIRLEIMLQADTWLGVSGTAGIPPPKSTNYVSTMITVPNNRTVIIGGLTSDTLAKMQTGIPILKDIPLLGMLFRYEIVEKKRSKLYLFVRPIILDDEKFEDLNKISWDKYEEAMGISLHSSEQQEDENKAGEENGKDK